MNIALTAEQPPVLIDEFRVSHFITNLREHGLEARAARDAGVPLNEIHNMAMFDTDLAWAIEDAKAEAADVLELEARRRAVEGIQKPVVYQGQITDYYTEYSDSLLTKLLTGRRREVFGDKREISGPGGAPVQVVVKTFGDAPTQPAPIDITPQPEDATLSPELLDEFTF